MFARSKHRSPALKSGVFSLFFSPIALVLLGISMTDMQLRTALGLPLSSVEGMIGMALAALLLGLVAVNCDESAAGLFVAAALSVPVGALQFAGWLHLPSYGQSIVTGQDVAASIRWSMHPITVTGILLGSALAVFLAHRAARNGKLTVRGNQNGLTKFKWVRLIVATAAIPLTICAILLLLRATLEDTTVLASQGMSGLVTTNATPVAALCATFALTMVAVSSRWSLLGPQVSAWLVLVTPFYLVLPLWATLSGNVVTPGSTPAATQALAAPVIAGFGMVLGSTTLGVHWVRRRHATAKRMAPGATDAAMTNHAESNWRQAAPLTPDEDA